jgi:hypothetical protein
MATRDTVTYAFQGYETFGGETAPAGSAPVPAAGKSTQGSK